MHTPENTSEDEDIEQVHLLFRKAGATKGSIS